VTNADGTTTVPAICATNPDYRPDYADKNDKSHHTATKETAELWHSRLGHPSYTTMANLLKHKAATGVHIKPEDCTQAGTHICPTCAVSKSTKQPFKPSDTDYTEPLQLISSDVCGPMRTTSLGGNNYFLTVVDHATDYSIVQALKTKDQAPSAIKSTIEWLETQTDRKVKAIRTDNGKEYVNKALDDYLKSKGIHHEGTIPYSPQMNGKAERLNRTLLDKARSLLHNTTLPKYMWSDAVVTANYLRNRTPTSSSHKTPYERMWNKTPDLQHLRAFGATAYAHIPKEKRASKFDPRAHTGIMVGYALQSKGWRVYLPQQRTVLETRDCIFDEATIFNKPLSSTAQAQAQAAPTIDWDMELTPIDLSADTRAPDPQPASQPASPTQPAQPPPQPAQPPQPAHPPPQPAPQSSQPPPQPAIPPTTSQTATQPPKNCHFDFSS
jgi:hypothetical protein